MRQNTLRLILAAQLLCVIIIGYVCRHEGQIPTELSGLVYLIFSPVTLVGFPLLGVLTVSLVERRGKEVLYVMLVETALVGAFLLAMLPAVQ